MPKLFWRSFNQRSPAYLANYLVKPADTKQQSTATQSKKGKNTSNLN